MRNLLAVICLLATSSALSAQGNPGGWENLRTLTPGQTIQVVTVTAHPAAGSGSGSAHKSSGAFVQVSDTALVYTQPEGNRTVARGDVRSVQLAGGRRWRHALIGTGVGAAAGGGITAAAWESGGFLGGRGTGAAVGAVLGGLTGAVVGAVLPSHTTIYSVPR